MYALGRDELPQTVTANGIPYELERTVKHDFWAATGFYRAATDAPRGTERAVVKINRRASLLGIPMKWTGRKLCRREVRAYAKLQDLPNIPRLLGDATDTGFIHAYIEGQPIRRDVPVPDGFFDELLELIAEMQRRGLAYVDTNKPENILQSVDGRPCLIDFQISFDASAWWPRWLGRKLLRACYRGDVYHVLKQKRRFRPADLTPAERAIIETRSWPIRVHRIMARPYFLVRRPMMRWLTRSGWIEAETSK